MKKSWSLGHHPVTVNAFVDGLLHGSGTAGRSGGSPGTEAGVSPTPNCLEPSGSRRTEGRPRAARRSRAGPQGTLRQRRPDVALQCGHHKVSSGPWKTQYVKILVQKNKTSTD